VHEDNEDALTDVSFTSSLLTKENKRKFNLKTLLELKEEVEEKMDPELRRIISEHKFIGCVSHKTALIQHQTKLYAVDVARLRQEIPEYITIRGP
jgi:DNA mismatch repair protein MLH1